MDKESLSITYEIPGRFKQAIHRIPFIKYGEQGAESTPHGIKIAAGIDMWDELAQLVTNADIQEVFKSAGVTGVFVVGTGFTYHGKNESKEEWDEDRETVVETKAKQQNALEAIHQLLKNHKLLKAKNNTRWQSVFKNNPMDFIADQLTQAQHLTIKQRRDLMFQLVEQCSIWESASRVLPEQGKDALAANLQHKAMWLMFLGTIGGTGTGITSFVNTVGAEKAVEVMDNVLHGWFAASNINAAVAAAVKISAEFYRLKRLDQDAQIEDEAFKIVGTEDPEIQLYKRISVQDHAQEIKASKAMIAAKSGTVASNALLAVSNIGGIASIATKIAAAPVFGGALAAAVTSALSAFTIERKSEKRHGNPEKLGESAKEHRQANTPNNPERSAENQFSRESKLGLEKTIEVAQTKLASLVLHSIERIPSSQRNFERKRQTYLDKLISSGNKSYVADNELASGKTPVNEKYLST